MELDGTVALVTGASRRLGKAIAGALAAEGCAVVLHYGRSREAAETTADELRQLGTEVETISADLRNEAEIVEMFRCVEERFGYLDVLVNSAASFEKKVLTAIASEDWERVMAVNLKAPFLCTQLAAPFLRQARKSRSEPGLVVNIGDLSGELPWPGYAHHGTSKAGLLHLTRIAARELAPAIRVNAIVPGPVLPPPEASEDDPQWRDLIRRIPAGRSGRPAEVGQTVVFLARNDFIYGETIHVDGGEHLLGAGHRDL